jgi:RHS repeat-associated protein
VFVSNQQRNITMFFDDLMVNHERGRLLQEDSYYPDGLKMTAICARALSKLPNRYGYQGNFSEEDEESGYNEFALRMYDPQLGRWISADPYDEFASPYIGMGNDPVNNVDPNGGCILCAVNTFSNFLGFGNIFDLESRIIPGAEVQTTVPSFFAKVKKVIKEFFIEASKVHAIAGVQPRTPHEIIVKLLGSEQAASYFRSNIPADLEIPDPGTIKPGPKKNLMEKWADYNKALTVVSEAYPVLGVNIRGSVGVYNTADGVVVMGSSLVVGHTNGVDLQGHRLSGMGYTERMDKTMGGLVTVTTFAFTPAVRAADAAAAEAVAEVRAAAEGGVESLGAGRTAVKQWLQSAGNLEQETLIQNIESAGFKRVSPITSPVSVFERGGMRIRLDPPQSGTPFNHMHLEYGGKSYNIFLDPVNYKSPAAHIPIR